METYNPTGLCPMCEKSGVQTQYIKESHTMERKCGGCGHKWNEKPLSPKTEGSDDSGSGQLILG